MLCTACGKETFYCNMVEHPMLPNIPICQPCDMVYHSGEFTVTEENEIYCRWCGQGEGELVLCDSCPKSFCSGCIVRNFGQSEIYRIHQLSERWNCFVCNPLMIQDLSKKNGWIMKKKHYHVMSAYEAPLDSSSSFTNKLSPYLICSDVSRGREKFEIPVINEVDKAAPPLDFIYVAEHVAGENVNLTNNPKLVKICCTCTDNCKDPKRCECAQYMKGSFPYNVDGILVNEKPNGIFEFNQRCRCHIDRCKNRLVGKGPHLRLEIFRCQNPSKGWGVRCKTAIPAGTYVADYAGEILKEKDAEKRGLTKSDEYLFTLDHWGRSQASKQLSELGLTKNFIRTPRDVDMNVSTMSENQLKEYLDENLIELLKKRKSIEKSLDVVMVVDKDEHDSVEPKNVTDKKISWFDHQQQKRMKLWNEARSIITDRVVLEVEEKQETFIIDARWYGSVGRFLNHSCSPNLDIVTVYCKSQDIRIPRVAFFANDYIPADTELCYDYGYYPGNVEGKHRECLCGAVNCREKLY